MMGNILLNFCQNNVTFDLSSYFEFIGEVFLGKVEQLLLLWQKYLRYCVLFVKESKLG